MGSSALIEGCRSLGGHLIQFGIPTAVSEERLFWPSKTLTDDQEFEATYSALSPAGVHRPLQTPDLSGFYSLTSGSMGQLPHTVSW